MSTKEEELFDAMARDGMALEYIKDTIAARRELFGGGSKEGCARCSAEAHAAMAAPEGGAHVTNPSKPTKPVVGPWESDGKARRRSIGALEHARVWRFEGTQCEYQYMAWRDDGTRLVTGECATEAEAMAAADQALRDAGLLPAEEPITFPGKPTKPLQADPSGADLRKRLGLLVERMRNEALIRAGSNVMQTFGEQMAYEAMADMLEKELAK